MYQYLIFQFAHFGKNKDGSVAVVFAVTLFLILLVMCIAIDVNTLTSRKSKIQDKTDAATLAVAKLVYLEGASQKEGQALFDHFLADYSKNGRMTCDPIIFKDQGNSVVTNCDGKIEPIMPRIIGKDKLGFKVTSSVVAGFQKNFEVSFVFDISNSMKLKQITALEATLDKLVSSDMFKNNSEKAVFSLIPFANTVAFDTSTYNKWVDKSIDPTFTGCFTRATTDITKAFTGGRDETSAPMRIGTMTVNSCPPQPMSARFFNKSRGSVNSMITGIQTTFGTGTSDALMWGYRSLHPDMRNVITTNKTFPRDFSEQNKKLLILLTDGKPFNSPWTNDEKNLDGGKDPDQAGYEKFVETCNHIDSKDELVDIWVIALGNFVNKSGFDLRGAFTDCTRGKGKFLEADDKSLSDMITGIIENEMNLRISN